jgi:heptosyltransferase III
MRRGIKSNRLLDFWLGIPVINLLATFRLHRRRWPENVQRIGVMCSPALGDTILFSGALQDVRRAFPNAELIHICMPQNLAAAELIPGADKRLVITLTKPSETILRIRAERLDVLLDFTSWQRLTAFYTLTSGARFTAGFSTPGQHRSRVYDLTAEHRDDRHEVENFRAILRAVGIEPRSNPTLQVPSVSSQPLPGETDIVVLHLWASGARSWLREWPEDRWVELAQRLAGPDTVFTITGSPTDMSRTEPFVHRLQAAGLRATPYISPDGFRSLSHLLLRARLVVSVNTGVMHLAATLGAPTLSINGPNRNGRWGPLGVAAIGIESPGPGCGYLHLGFNFDGQATDCMDRITVDMVAAAAAQVMMARR